VSRGRRPSAVLIDGYNLLHAIPRFAPRGGPLAPARSRLETWLARVARERDVSRCVIVWDGRERGSRSRSSALLEVIYLGFVPLGAMTFWKRWTDEPGGRKGRRNPVSDAPEPSEKPRPTKAGVEDLLAAMLGEEEEGDDGRS